MAGIVVLLVAIVCCLASVGAEIPATNHRHARQTALKPEYYVDVLVLTDYSAYKAWYDRTPVTRSPSSRRNETLVNMKRYFTVVLREVTLQYSRLETSFVLKFSPVEFDIIDSEGAVTWTERNGQGMVNASQALDRLVNWLKHRPSLPAYDHALLFTGENLDSNDNGITAGLGTLGTVCHVAGRSSVSVVEDNGAFQSVRVAVHELGHSLNAVHDGIANECPASGRYVMAAGTSDVTPENARHPWFFSSCSTTEIEAYVQGLVASANEQSINCLRTQLPSSGVPDVTGVTPGQLFDADEQCQHLYGARSSFYFLGNLTNVCTLLSCGDPTDGLGNKYWQRVAATGTTCGNKQWCQVGQCVSSPDAPAVGACFRDSVTSVNGLKCPDLVARQPAQCYEEDVVNTFCCQSCANINSGVKGCPYGDRKTGCTKATCRRIFSDGLVLDYDCCGTCSFDSSTWVCTDTALVDGLPCPEAVRRNGVQGCYNTTLVEGLSCPEAVRRNGVQGCYNTTLAFLCCATCQQQRDLNKGKGCEYGDRLLNLCPYTAGSDATEDCDVTLCCDTCRQTAGSGPTGRPSAAILMLAFFTGLCFINHNSFGQPQFHWLGLV